MPPPNADRPANSSARWRIAWLLIAIVVIGGVVLTLRLGPRLTPVLESVR
jgi:hypothetical protein